MADTEEIQDLDKKVKRAFDNYIRSVAEETEGNLRERANKEAENPTGALAQSWFIDQKTNRYILIKSDEGYAFVVSEGSEGPYTIKPNDVDYLRFKVDGDVVFAKKVTHPGIEGNEYIKMAINDTEEKLDKIAQMELSKQGL